GVNIEEAATQVRERISQVRWKFPPEAKEPMINRFDVAAVPVLIYTVRGERSLSETRKFAEDGIKPALGQGAGVANVDVRGGATREIQVDLDRARVDALGIDPSMVVARLRAANLTVPAGRYDEGTREISVRTVGELPGAEAVREIIVATNKDGSAVRLRDIATIEDGYEELRTRVRANGDVAVSFAILKQS